MSGPGSALNAVFLALQAENGRFRYVDNRSPTMTAGKHAAMKILVRQLCDDVTETVEISGRLYVSKIHLLKSDPSTAYVETDCDGVPLDAESVPIREIQDDFKHRLLISCRTSDSLTPDTRIEIGSSFVAPTFELSSDSADPSTLAWEDLREYARLVITGGPGSGKTTCLRRMAVEEIQARNQTIPLYIQLRDVDADLLTVSGLSRLLAIEGAGDLVSEFADPLNGGRLLLLLDGLDELPSDAERMGLIERLDALCLAAPRLRVVLSSRTGYEEVSPSGFTIAAIRPFDMAHRIQWLSLYFAQMGRIDLRARLAAVIFEDPDLQDLSRSPLMLGLIASLYQQYPSDLNDRALLLRKCTDVLVHDWDASRNIARWRGSSVTPRQITTLLGQLAARLLQEHRTEFTTDDVLRVTESNASYHDAPLSILRACRSTGFIEASNDDHWTFTHESLRSYLAANYIVARPQVSENTLVTYFGDLSTRHTFALSCGLATDADGLLATALARKDSPHHPGTLMIADVLDQQLSASPDLLRQCCSRVVSDLENELSRSRLVVSDQPDPSESLIVGALALASREDSTDALAFLAETLPMLHRARYGQVADLLKDGLDQSTDPAVKAVRQLLNLDGRCEVEPATFDGSPGIRLVVKSAQGAGDG
ncbi:NACHT domain-containing protein [Kribbella steppae]|uniref:NACHT domain-containing protein n=1 Tax=Kribbella steppae TaxID=2512223 RepID=A0A4R2HDS2_9ACTN|nr:NACHT domain-containing protein [Kribbella steppae]TCO26410.1 NACHT domain-containing protein [Kribbella steppae]